MDVVSTVVVRPCSTHGINRIRKICSFWPRLVARPAAPELPALLNNVDSIASAIHLRRLWKAPCCRSLGKPQERGKHDSDQILSIPQFNYSGTSTSTWCSG